MDPSGTVMVKPSRKMRIVESLLSVVIALVVSGIMFWNWDGFWQTEIPMLTSAQETYFPAKHAEEQYKLVNTRTNTVRWTEVLRKIETLETENGKLTEALKPCEKQQRQVLE